jgi:hypothetical protein
MRAGAIVKKGGERMAMWEAAFLNHSAFWSLSHTNVGLPRATASQSGSKEDVTLAVTNGRKISFVWDSSGGLVFLKGYLYAAQQWRFFNT